MKRLGFIAKIAEHRATGIRYAIAGFASAIAAVGAVAITIPVWNEFKTSFAYRDFQKYGIVGTYQHRFFSVFGKMKDLESADRENIELNQRLAQLEKQFEMERSRNASAEMKEITEELGDRIRDEAGSELARVLASIPYNVPTQLLPHQQYALALGYFRKQEYEQCAVLLNHLLNLQDDTSYQRGEVQLLSAISWYHLKNYKLAKHYLRAVVKGSNPNTSLYRTSVLWEAILAKSEGKKQEAQRYLTAALAQFPHSLEASWINRKIASHEMREPNQALLRQQELKESDHKARSHVEQSLPTETHEQKSAHEEKKHE